MVERSARHVDECVDKDSVEDYIEALYSESIECLGPNTSHRLLEASLQAINGKAQGDTGVEIEYNGYAIKLVIPVAQLPEAWANLLHIYCSQDYSLLPSYKPRPGVAVLDIGAYLGFYTLYALVNTKYESIIVAVEPNPVARHYLYLNLELNNAENNVRVDPRAVSVKSGIGRLYVTRYWATSSLYSEYIQSYTCTGVYRVVNVRLAALDEIIRDHELNVHSTLLVKMDIEGAERELLALLPSLGVRAKWVVELHGRIGWKRLEPLVKSGEVEIAETRTLNQSMLYYTPALG